ncbi:MAG: class I SAM-dependent methyltransferase [Sphingomonadaceae bacterium]
MSKAHEKIVEQQFGPQARAYVESTVHAQGEDLVALGDVVRSQRPKHALDLGTGGGHVSYIMAPHATQVTAVDLSPEMLAAVRATAREKGLVNVQTIEAPAERLPFEDGHFDFLACRYSAHHWRDFEAGMREARRVVQTGGRAIFIDAYSPGATLIDTHLQAVEVLRDTSHVRDYSAAEWLAALGRSGFAHTSSRTWRLRMDFPVWTARMRTPAENVRAIRALQQSASYATKAHFAIEDDGSFMLDVLMIEASAA